MARAGAAFGLAHGRGIVTAGLRIRQERSTDMNTTKIESGKTRMVAHRGVSGLEKENTNAAFVAAGNRSYFGIETDVHRTLDGKYVCFHDDQTGRVAIDDMCVEKTTFDTLRGLLLTDRDGEKGRTDLRIPTLQEYVRICRKYEKTGVLELKNTFDPKDVEEIIDIIRAEEYLDGIIFISFSLENMLTLRRLLPTHPCQYLTCEYSDELVKTLVDNRLDLDILHTALDEANIANLHAHGVKVNCWTCDDPDRAADLVRWGVDFITSNILE